MKVEKIFKFAKKNIEKIIKYSIILASLLFISYQQANYNTEYIVRNKSTFLLSSSAHKIEQNILLHNTNEIKINLNIPSHNEEANIVFYLTQDNIRDKFVYVSKPSDFSWTWINLKFDFEKFKNKYATLQFSNQESSFSCEFQVLRDGGSNNIGFLRYDDKLTCDSLMLVVNSPTLKNFGKFFLVIIISFIVLKSILPILLNYPASFFYILICVTLIFNKTTPFEITKNGFILSTWVNHAHYLKARPRSTGNHRSLT